jgi:hypothetical protein
MLYRRAVAMAEQAEQRAAQFAERSSSERRLRMIDAVMETIILSQAAAEGWIYAAYRLAGEKPRGRGWRECWAQAPKIIAGSDARDLDEATSDTLDWLSAWRNYLVHDDDRARERVAEYVRAGSETDHLTAEMAREVITCVDAAFTDIGSRAVPLEFRVVDLGEGGERGARARPRVEECPSRRLTSSSVSPLASPSEADVWRRSCSRIGGRPVLRMRRLKCLETLPGVNASHLCQQLRGGVTRSPSRCPRPSRSRSGRSDQRQIPAGAQTTSSTRHSSSRLERERRPPPADSRPTVGRNRTLGATAPARRAFWVHRTTPPMQTAHHTDNSVDVAASHIAESVRRREDLGGAGGASICAHGCSLQVSRKTDPLTRTTGVGRPRGPTCLLTGWVASRSLRAGAGRRCMPANEPGVGRSRSPCDDQVRVRRLRAASV